MFPLPGNATVPPLDQAAVVQAFEQAFSNWRDIPTSYIDMGIVGTTDTNQPIGFDFVNEISFVPIGLQFGGFSPSYTLIADSELIGGDDLDLDGDPDVADGIDGCVDTDADGDVEFPSGFYRAGTILENDVFLHPEISWAVDEAYSDLAWDLVGVLTHELGHSHGLAHSAIVQTSDKDSDAATMFNAPRNFLATFDERTLHSDDIAWSSFLYPEGSKKTGPGRLQKGDIRFGKKYSVISGEVLNPQNLPVVGALIFAEDLLGNVVTSTIAGHARLSVDATNYVQYASTLNLLPPSLGIVDGKFELPVPKGIYRLGIEANDLAPEPTLATLVAAIGYLYGHQDFVEEYYSGRRESSSEIRLNDAAPVFAWQDRDDIRFIHENNVELRPFDELNYAAPVFVTPPGPLFAVRIPREQVLAVDNGFGIAIQAATFGTWPIDSTDIATYASAMITTGTVSEDGTVTVDTANPLEKKAPFIGQDFDMTPLYSRFPRALGLRAQHWLPHFNQDLFVVLQFPLDEYPGSPGYSRYGILAKYAQPGETGAGTSYYSIDGGTTWVQEAPGFDYGFGLVVAPLEGPAWQHH
jgi:hypothetical protein